METGKVPGNFAEGNQQQKIKHDGKDYKRMRVYLGYSYL